MVNGIKFPTDRSNNGQMWWLKSTLRKLYQTALEVIESAGGIYVGLIRGSFQRDVDLKTFQCKKTCK